MADETKNECCCGADETEKVEGTTEGCGCGCEHDHEAEEAGDAHMVLEDEEGVEVEFEYIGTVDYEGAEYVVLLPVEDDENGEAEVLILKVEVTTGTDEDGEEFEEEQYVSVESEDVLNAVFDIFKSENADMFEFVEE